MKIKDIAKIANVSTSTVSIVLNGKQGVGDDTRKRVKELLTQNGYKIGGSNNKTNKNIVFVKYKTNGAIVEDNQGFISSMIDFIERRCNQRGYNLLVAYFTPDNIKNIKNILDKSEIEGLIVLGTELEEEYFYEIENIDIPMAVVDNQMEYRNVDSVVMDNVDIAFNAVSYLYRLGHRKIGYLHSKMNISNFSKRYEGYRKSMEYYNLNYDKQSVYIVTPTMHDSYEDLKKLLDKPNMPTAFLAANDMIAIGSIKAIKELGYNVPKDISIIGIDNIPFCTIFDPPITTMGISREKIGYSVVDLLIKRISNPTSPNIKILVGGKLIERNSTIDKK